MSTPATAITNSGVPNPATTAGQDAGVNGATGGSPAAQPAHQGPTTQELQEQIEALRASNAEVTQAAQYWKDKASSGRQPEVKTQPAADDDVDVLTELTEKGAVGFDKIAEKRGFIRKDQVETLINAKASALTREQALQAEYPDLKDGKSEFFKATAVHYHRLIKDGTPELVAMEQAARTTELEFMRAGKIKTPDQQKEEAKQERERQRRARIDAQGGEGGRAPSNSNGEDEGDDELDAHQKRICEVMGITEEQYKARAKKGVAMKGIGR